ncbi:MAG: metallophosphatase domain-containing protein [Ardenticatenales bacterium]|nr:metallophosphatase domain-containing protein [Ardenticatenales bacterium]
MTLTIVALSDTHSLHGQLAIPDGDILLHAGDITRQGDIADVVEFNAFLGTLPHRHKVVIAGNHDFCFERLPNRCRQLLTNAIYLEDESVTLEGIKIYGSPWQPWFHDWAFNLARGEPLRRKWALIPPDTDILITHGPPLGHGDRTTLNEVVGCADLLEAVQRLRPRYHLFGHIHEAYGVTRNEHTTFINASSCTFKYTATNPPIVFDYGL